MRSVKEAGERKSQILDAACALFASKGYESTSIADIQDYVGIARGTMYYHFSSKEAIAGALADRINGEFLKRAAGLAGDPSMPAPARILMVLQSLRIEDDPSKASLMALLHNPANLQLHQRIQTGLVRDLSPLLAHIVQDGMAQGLFSCPYPFEAMELIVGYVGNVLDNPALVDSKEAEKRRIRALIHHAERILGAREGLLSDFYAAFGV